MGLELKYAEGQTPIDEEEKRGLKIKAISTMGELNAFEQQNIEEAMQWTLKKSPDAETILSKTFINSVHGKMFGNVWDWAGNYRLSNKNIGVDYYNVSRELRMLIDDCRYWIAHNTFPADEIAVRFKHRLVAIHLYPTGNGRHSRLMGDILAEALARKPFSWGGKSVAKDESRKLYINALRAADQGDFAPLIAFSRS